MGISPIEFRVALVLERGLRPPSLFRRTSQTPPVTIWGWRGGNGQTEVMQGDGWGEEEASEYPSHQNGNENDNDDSNNQAS